MKPKSQVAILKSVVKQLTADVAELRELVEELEKAHDIDTNVLTAEVMDLQWRLKQLEKKRGDELTGSIDGLDDTTLHVKIQTPQEHAWIKRQRWGRATQTPVPLWTTGGRNGDGSA
jgi:hypothetical protein